MLKVSRPEIDTNSLTDYAADARFLKLPVARYISEVVSAKIIPECLNAPQIALINAVNSPNYRFVVAAYSRRVGKTTVANMIANLVCLVPNSSVLIMSPNYSLSSISFEIQRKYVKAFDLTVTRDNLKDRMLELSNGSTVRMGSVSQVDSCVGRSYDLILFDEAALSSEGEDAFNIALRPTLDKANSKAIFISTPRGKLNWFSRFFERGFSAEFPEWCALHCDYLANPRAVESDVEEARRSMSSQEFAQEYLASFNTFEGQIFKFAADTCVQDLSDYDYSSDEIICGLDIGFKDATAAVVIAYSESDNCYRVLTEYHESQRTTSEHAISVKSLETKFDIRCIFIDSSAQQTRYDWAQNHDIATINANKSVLDGIAFTQAIVESNRLIVDSSCTHTLAALDQYRWDTRSNIQKEKPVHDQYSHIADALRYALYTYSVSSGTV